MADDSVYNFCSCATLVSCKRSIKLTDVSKLLDWVKHKRRLTASSQQLSGAIFEWATIWRFADCAAACTKMYARQCLQMAGELTNAFSKEWDNLWAAQFPTRR
jgi:hypothetical protein